MKTRINDNSVYAYTHLDFNTRSKHKAAIIEIIKSTGTISTEGICYHTGIKQSTVAGRVNELRYEDKVIKFVKRIRNIRNAPLDMFRLREKDEQPDERPPSWEEKYNELEKQHDNLICRYAIMVDELITLKDNNGKSK